MSRPPGVRLLVTGGRHFNQQEKVRHALDTLLRQKGIAVLMHGACPVGWGGADKLAHLWCYERGVPVLPFRPNEELDGKWPGAGPHRNERMLRQGKPTAAVAFPGDEGTTDMVKRLRLARIPVWIPFGGVRDPGPPSDTRQQQDDRTRAAPRREARRG